ncbi:MAG: hypothetical protein DI538_26180, partial [Azospira oryzae]
VFSWSVYQDVPFLQDYSIQYFLPEGKKGKVNLYQVAADRNKNIQILSSAGLLSPRKGHFKEPGTLLPVVTYKYMKDKQITGLLSYQNQFVYTDDKAVFSNAWAGGLYAAHGSKSPRTIAGGDDFSFLVSDHEKTTYIRNGNKVWEEKLPAINSIKFNAQKNNYLLVSTDAVSLFDPAGNKLTTIYKGRNLTCATFAHMGEKIVVGSTDGYRWLNANGSTDGEIITHVPSANISDVEEIDGTIWFGSRAGAFALNKEGKYDYYASQRWLPDNNVLDIAAGPDKSILVLTEKGLGQICFKMMTLEEKAMILEEETRKNHIRYGFSSTGEGMENGDRSLLTITDSDNDGLWTAMYLGGQLFRYEVTKDAEAWENCKEALMGFERLYSITGVPGLPARAYEVMGYESSGYSNAFSESTRHLFESSGYDVANSPWRNGTDKGWVWKSTTSSDEIVGHYFALSLFADLADDPVWKNRAKKLLTELSEHIYKNNLYLVDWNGKPTTWGKWNPEYVNEYPPKVGDRKITSSNITAFLQSAYHFTRDEKYKQKIFELFDKHGYLENLMRPMNEIGKVEGSDDGKIDSWAEMLSDGWNHSDDEMYFLGYWSLYPYALNDTLREKYREAIRDHWEIERPEKDPTWNFTYAMTGAKDFDLDESIWWLKRHPLDLTLWKTENSQRQDIKKLPENFRKQFTEEVISPAEAPVNKHNGNRFELDSNGNGNNAETPGDVWLLPYWMGRYLDVISAPVKQ